MTRPGRQSPLRTRTRPPVTSKQSGDPAPGRTEHRGGRLGEHQGGYFTPPHLILPSNPLSARRGPAPCAGVLLPQLLGASWGQQCQDPALEPLGGDTPSKPPKTGAWEEGLLSFGPVWPVPSPPVPPCSPEAVGDVPAVPNAQPVSTPNSLVQAGVLTTRGLQERERRIREARPPAQGHTAQSRKH